MRTPTSAVLIFSQPADPLGRLAAEPLVDDELNAGSGDAVPVAQDLCGTPTRCIDHRCVPDSSQLVRAESMSSRRLLSLVSCVVARGLRSIRIHEISPGASPR